MTIEERLIIYKNRSVLEKDQQAPQTFFEGRPSQKAKERTDLIRKHLEDGFLKQIIDEERQYISQNESLSDEQQHIIKNLVDSVTSEVGRALIGLTVLQLTIKSICSLQSIRLHKGGRGDFSWVEGISMRTLDKNYITPILREYSLLSLNADGFMMTRSLAENYPYSTLYKAAMRGAKVEWVTIVEALEDGTLPALPALRHLISLLINRSDNFLMLADSCLSQAELFLENTSNSQCIFKALQSFVESSEYSARAFEVVIHAAYQALEEMKEVEPNRLKPLSQMRSANKKHGNIGDIELLAPGKAVSIVESWDTKYGKDNLREELEELFEKLAFHPECELAGFITNKVPIISNEIYRRIGEIEDYYDCRIIILSFADWYKKVTEKLTNERKNDFVKQWLIAVVESFCQKRRKIAPIDEPCEYWIKSLTTILNDTRKES